MKNVLVTGKPAVGKTTLIKRIADRLPPHTYHGFLTEEIRQNHKRVGFAIETFDGVRKILSHVDFQSRHRVGRYDVDVTALDEIIEHITRTSEGTPALFLVDEIGKMESFSARFREWIQEILGGPVPVAATISLGGNPWINFLKNYPDTEIFTLTAENRDTLCEELYRIVSKQIERQE